MIITAHLSDPTTRGPLSPACGSDYFVPGPELRPSGITFTLASRKDMKVNVGHKANLTFTLGVQDLKRLRTTAGDKISPCTLCLAALEH